MKDLKYYSEWHSKWTKVFRYLCDKRERTHRINYLIQEVQKHIWQIEWRLQCIKWYGENANTSPMFPKTLRR